MTTEESNALKRLLVLVYSLFCLNYAFARPFLVWIKSGWRLAIILIDLTFSSMHLILKQHIS